VMSRVRNMRVLLCKIRQEDSLARKFGRMPFRN
jgi:hypothetical protein